jgi:NAD(P)-dependent dehydrogenase (short-subunit alcohol dehydrogenase family)
VKGSVAIVTGSTSGIRLGIARELARRADIMFNGFGDSGEFEVIRNGYLGRWRPDCAVVAAEGDQHA